MREMPYIQSYHVGNRRGGNQNILDEFREFLDARGGRETRCDRDERPQINDHQGSRRDIGSTPHDINSYGCRWPVACDRNAGRSAAHC